MKTSLYFNYTSRSLLRGGQRTVLAVFCVAVGVMAVVALQLVGFMLQNSLTSNVRVSNGGDIAVTASSVPLKTSDLAFFAQLKSAGTIDNYTAVVGANGALTATASSLQSFSVEAVDPSNFPLVAPPSFVQPNNGTVASLLTNQQVIVTQSFMDKYQKHLGDTLTVYIKANTGSGQTLHVKIAGIIANSGMFAQAGNLVLISALDYLASVPVTSANYSLVNITTVNRSSTDVVVKAIEQQFPLVSTSTVAQVLKSEQASLDIITKFLEITGLLSLLIGGVGIINTMQVLLSRRKTEIAMLKTAGYHRSDLYLLFGLEAGLLGLIGGLVGSAAATDVSYLVRGLLQSSGLNVPFVLMFGLCLLVASLFGIVVVLLPSAWKVSMKMALRNLGRRRARTTATILALFIGIFGIGLVVTLGQDLQTQVSGLFAQQLPYNIIVTTSGHDTSTLQAHLSTLPGLKGNREDTLTRALPSAINGQSLQQMLPTGSDRQTVAGLLSGIEGYNLSQNVPSMKVDPVQVDHALDALGNSVPNATVEGLADIGASFAQQLNGILEILIAIASLSVIAAVIIIANAVALAMLERRRELGILKAVGYTSGTVLSEIMIENGIVGVVGAFIAALLAAGGVALLGSLAFNLTLRMSPSILVSLVGGSALLAILTAVLVSWQAGRVRPLEVLRYE